MQYIVISFLISILCAKHFMLEYSKIYGESIFCLNVLQQLHDSEKREREREREGEKELKL